MTTRDVGDRVDLRHLVYDASGTPTNATVVLTVTDPAGSITTPSVTNTPSGIYDAGFTLNLAGLWTWKWSVTGTVTDVEYGEVTAADPAPQTYATLPELKAYMRVADTTEDALLQLALLTASRKVDKTCGRRFFADTTATARVFKPRSYEVAVVDDFWTTTGLVVKVDTADNATYSATLDSTRYELEPFNNIVDGESGWPYYRIRSLQCEFLMWNRRKASLQVTAKWGWPAVPDPVKQACILLAEETFKLKDSPFGVTNVDQFGPVRVRDNPKVMAMLAPYTRDAVLVG